MKKSCLQEEFLSSEDATSSRPDREMDLPPTDDSSEEEEEAENGEN